ncbi:hypothetical protein PSA5_11705 [Pseudomonas syringae pv. actinidiae]|nr:hypothetical protein PSA5_11705 [Pseudomonas syringae pv. actinidiae]
MPARNEPTDRIPHHAHPNIKTHLRERLAASSILGGLGLWRSPAWALPNPGQPDGLSGTEFDLTIGETQVNITGNARTAMTINGGIPGPLLRWREGDTVTLRVKNRLDETTSIHWHGIILPATWTACRG